MTYTKEEKEFGKRILKLSKTLNDTREKFAKLEIKNKKRKYGKYANIEDEKSILKEVKETRKQDKLLKNRLK